MILIISLINLISTSTYASPNFAWMETMKKNCRQTITGNIPSGHPSARMPIFSPILDGDHAEDLVDFPSRMIRNLLTMDRNHLLSKELTVAPWSDSYWPMYLGGIAQRYNDRNFTSYDWKNAKDYVMKNPVSSLIHKKEFDFLSPAEKYDFLFGINGHTLTSSNWADGEEYFKEYGNVETWMGLCHGWSAAAIMMPNPEKKVEVPTSAGNITFYPSDIKALGTLLWAKGSASTRFIGGRCNSKDPKTDPMGRPKEEDCLDNNPGTWHLAIVNQIGQFDRSFVMDSTYDYQVWNQPVFGYQYSYYNPKTGKKVSTLSEATVKRTDWAADPRKSARSHEATSIVGIHMTVTYVVEDSPSTREYQFTEFSSVDYQYDLELNARMEIIGGEWYGYNHPDFLWVPEQKAFPRTYGDSGSTRVNLQDISGDMKKLAASNAAFGLPFGPVVREFFRESAKE